MRNHIWKEQLCGLQIYILVHMTFTHIRTELFSASDWSQSLKLKRWVALYLISHFKVYWRLSLQYSLCFWTVCVAETVWYLPPVLHYLILVLFCYSDSLKHHVPPYDTAVHMWRIMGAQISCIFHEQQEEYTKLYF